jgi:hypothetical protein
MASTQALIIKATYTTNNNSLFFITLHYYFQN